MAVERQHRPIDKEFEECYYSGVLDISGRNLRMFPNIGDDIYDPLEVFTGIISGNRFDKFPKTVLTYLNIVTLNFHNNSLRSIPGDLTRLQQLRHLDLSRNFLHKLPSALCELQLETLSLNNNRLQSLPPEIGEMSALKSLDISCNDLTVLPPSFTDLQSLLYLNLRRNEIRELPTDIYKIPLWYLNVSSNSLTRLPVTLRHQHTLTEFHCANNPLEVPPAQVCVRGLRHVLKYLSEMEKYGSDPQLFATNREESLARRRRDRSKNARPTSDASTISGEGSDYERSFLDEMSTFVQTAFGGKDGHFLGGRNDPELGGGTSRHWTQLRAYEENSPYRSGGSSNARYRSQSPGAIPPGQQPNSQGQQSTPTHSGSGSGRYGTLPRSGKDNTNNTTVQQPSGRGLVDEPSRSGSFHNYTSNRVSSPEYRTALRTLSSENAPAKVPSNPDLSSFNDERSYLSKRTELPSSSAHQYNSPHHNKRVSSSVTPSSSPSSSSTPKATPTDVGTEKDLPPDVTVIADRPASPSADRPPSPANSRDGSITPTPEDIDTDEPLTPKKTPEELTVENIIKLLETNDFNFASKWDEFGQKLEISLDTRQKVSAQAHMSQDYRTATEELIHAWLTNEDSKPSWKKLLTALEECGQSSISNLLKKTCLLLDDGVPIDANLTPQHKSTDRQVSFSVSVSEIPNPRMSVSSEADDEDLPRSISCPSTTSSNRKETDEDYEDSESPSPSPSPLQSPRKGPQPAPKPSPKKKDKDNTTTWPKKRNPHKRKGDVFKSIGKQDPNFTVRRMEVHMMEELEKIQDIKTEVEEVLGRSLSDDLGDDIHDGILLCELVNKLHPNTIAVIHKPKGKENISGPKKTMNIAAFIAACKKVGVPEALVCSAGDISEYKDPIRVSSCIRALLDTVSV